MADQETRDRLRMLHRPTVIERLKENLPFPKGSVPKNGLPFWGRIPLSSKLPIIEHPKDAFVLYRDKVGKKLWRQSQSNKFRLDDPFCLDVSYEYDPLHDVNLAHIYKSRNRRAVLRSQGLIAKRGEAVCTLNQFNNYRRYLQCIYRDTLKIAYERMMEDESDEIALSRATDCAEKALQTAKMRDLRESESMKARKRLEEGEVERIIRLKEKQKQFDERIGRLEVQKAEARRQRIIDSQAFDASVRYRNAVAEEISRAKVAAVRQRWRITEKERAKRMKEQEDNLKSLKAKEVKDRWQEKREYQEQRLERENELLQEAEEEMRLAVELRKSKGEAEYLRMQVALQKVKAKAERERQEELQKKMFRNIYVNELTDESIGGRALSSGAVSSRRTTGSSALAHRKSGAYLLDDDKADGGGTPSHFRHKVAMCIEAMEGALSTRTRPFDLWNLIRYVESQDTGKDEGKDNREDVGEEEKIEEEGEENLGSANDMVATAINSLLTNVVQGYVHHRVMHTLKEVYHEALDECHWLVEREQIRQALRYGEVCYHALRRDKILKGSIKTMGYNPCCALCCRRKKMKAKFNPEKMKRKIEAYNKRAERYRMMLEEGVDFVSDSSEDIAYFDDEEGTDGGRLDKNFENLSTNLRRKIVLLASQSVDERFRKFTAHRWRILKEVELSVLMERLCNMMLLYDSKEFLVSAEFQWAADILARDIMKEVRAQMRSERRDAAIQLREKRVAQTAQKTLRERNKKTTASVDRSTKEACTCSCRYEVEWLESDEVPLLRLHSRSPHQPSLPSIVNIDESS